MYRMLSKVIDNSRVSGTGITDNRDVGFVSKERLLGITYSNATVGAKERVHSR